MKQIWRVIPGMKPLFGAYAKYSQCIAFRDGKTLHVKIQKDIRLSDLEKDVKRALPVFMLTFGVGRLMAFAAVFALGMAFLAAFAIVGIFEELTVSAITDFDGMQNWDRWVLLGTFIAGASILGFLPQVLNGQEESPLRRFLSLWVDDNRGSRKRLQSRLKWARRYGTIKQVVVWNAAASLNTGMNSFLKGLQNSKLPVDFRVHTDEIEIITSRLNREGGYKAEVLNHDSANDPAHPEDHQAADPLVILDQLMGPMMSEAAAYLMAASSYRAKEAWTPYIRQAFSGEVRGSEVLARMGWERSRPAATEEDTIPGLTYDVFLSRADQDYGLIIVDRVQHQYAFCPHVNWAALTERYRYRLAGINASLILPEAEGRYVDDPTSLFLFLIGVSKAQWPQQHVAHLMGAYARACDQAGIFPGLSAISALMEDELGEAGIKSKKLPVLAAGMDVKDLTILSRNMESIGEYQLALHFALLTKPFEGALGTVRIARAYDRLGDPSTALSVQDEIKPLVKEFMRDRKMTSAQAQIVTDFYQQRAWIILNHGIDRPEDNVRTAAEYLRNVDTVLAQVVEFTPSAMHIWRQENYWATYYEAVSEYASSTDRHLEASLIPGVPLRWRLASRINAAVTTRREAVAEWFSNRPQDFSSIRQRIRRSYDLSIEGYEGKLSIGDEDEAPIGAHNAALSQMYLVQINARESKMSDDGKALTRAYELVDVALGLLQKTGSERKMHTILSEGVMIEEWALARKVKLPSATVLQAMRSKLDPSKLSASDQEILGTLKALETHQI